MCKGSKTRAPSSSPRSRSRRPASACIGQSSTPTSTSLPCSKASSAHGAGWPRGWAPPADDRAARPRPRRAGRMASSAAGLQRNDRGLMLRPLPSGAGKSKRRGPQAVPAGEAKREGSAQRATGTGYELSHFAKISGPGPSTGTAIAGFLKNLHQIDKQLQISPVCLWICQLIVRHRSRPAPPIAAAIGLGDPLRMLCDSGPEMPSHLCPLRLIDWKQPHHFIDNRQQVVAQFRLGHNTHRTW